MPWDSEFVSWLFEYLEGVKPWRVFLHGRYKNYRICNLSITVGSSVDDLWIYDFEAGFPVYPGEEDIVRERLMGGGCS